MHNTLGLKVFIRLCNKKKKIDLLEHLQRPNYDYEQLNLSQTQSRINIKKWEGKKKHFQHDWWRKIISFERKKKLAKFFARPTAMQPSRNVWQCIYDSEWLSQQNQSYNFHTKFFLLSKSDDNKRNVPLNFPSHFHNA